MIKPPYPYYGGKFTVKDEIWQRLGYTPNFVDPFFGGGSSLWFNPDFDWMAGQWTDNRKHLETVNDLDGMVANFWRSVKYDAATVAKYADWPINENDLHARHIWLVNQNIVPKLEGNPDFYDAKIAGYWVWGMCAWIGGRFCSGQGPWSVSEDGELVRLGTKGRGINRQLVYLKSTGQGINRQSPNLKDRSITEQWTEWLQFYFQRLQDRLRKVRVCSGDWTRVLGPTPTVYNGLTAVFLDPPYAASDRDGVYNQDSFTIANNVRDWAIENGDNPMLRIALSGYDIEMPENWELVQWSAQGGYENQGKNPSGNRHREQIWFSPHCLKPPKQIRMFE